MLSTDRALLRLHIEAVWGVRLPFLEKDELALLPESLQPNWRLCAAEIASGQIKIWRPDSGSEERRALLARLQEILSLSESSALPPGASREVAFRLTTAPVVPLATAEQLARPLIDDEHLLLKAFDPEATELLQPACQPLIGVIMHGRLLSLAHSSRRTAEACELGIDTLPAARRRGYALAATVVWSAVVQREGLTPIYSALVENAASLKLAVAAGYREFARVVTLE